MRASKAFLTIGLFTIQLWRCSSQKYYHEAVQFPSSNLEEVSSPLIISDHDQQRGLQDPPSFDDEFALPFQLIWNMAFDDESDATTNIIREPTEDELTGLFHATLKWLLVSAQEYYTPVQADMYLDRIQFTHYGSNFDENDEFPSTVGIEATAFFQANEWRDIPSVFQFLVAFSSGFNRTTFLEDYLSVAEPIDSIYRNVNDLRYNILPSEMGQSGLRISRTNLNLEWNYKIGFGIPDRIPTQAEYVGLQNAYNDWLVTVFMDAYPPNNDPDGGDNPPVFHMLQSSIYDKQFDAEQDPPIHTIRILTEVSFRQQHDNKKDEDGATNGPPLSSNIVTQQDLLDILKTVDLNKYRDNYLHRAKPNFSLFTGVISLSWTEV